MARASYVMRDGRLVPKSEARPLSPRGPRSGLPRPHVISDSMPDGLDGLINPSDGKWYTSKAAMRAANRALGLTEVGDQDFPAPPVRSEAEIKAEIAADVCQAYDALEAGADFMPAKTNDADDGGTLINQDLAVHA